MIPGSAAHHAVFNVLGTALQATTYTEWIARCQSLVTLPRATTVDFTNTHIVTLRRHDAVFREQTECIDFFVPDGMPLVWCLNWQGAGMKDRVYGPTFMPQCIPACPAPFTHYFLGGSSECVHRLKETFIAQYPGIRIVGCRHGYFSDDESPQIVAEINQLSPDFIWIGLGTPRQQAWIYQNKDRIKRGVILAVGYAFDVNAGTKADAPGWMKRAGLTWMFRLASEPRRLVWRYLKFNTLFLFYLFWDGLRGRAFQASAKAT